MKAKKIVVISSVLVATLLSGSWMLAQAQPDGKNGGFRDGKRQPPAAVGHRFLPRGTLRLLQLTDAQHEILKASSVVAADSMGELDSLHRSLRQLSLSGDYNSIEADAMSQRIGELSRILATDRAVTTNNLYQSLDDEQKQILATAIENQQNRALNR